MKIVDVETILINNITPYRGGRYWLLVQLITDEGIAAAAAIQLDTCSPNFLIQEYNVNALHRELFKEPIRFENGYIIPPTGPGLGIELNQAVVQRHLV